MKIKDIMEFFYEFCRINKIKCSPYSFYYFYLDVIETKTKKFGVYKKDSSIFLYYKFGGDIRTPYLPLVKYDILKNKRRYLKLCKSYFKKVPKKNVKIIYVPKRFRVIFEGLYKITHYDTEYLYSTKEYNKLEGSKFHKIRYSVGRFERDHENIVIKNIKNQKDYANTKQIIEDWAKKARDRFFRVYDTNKNRAWLDHLKSDIVEQYGYILYADEKPIAIAGLFKQYPSLKNQIYFFIFKNYRKYDNSSRYLFTKILKLMYKKGFEYINLAGSVGLKGLKKFKENLRPCDTIDIYNLHIENNYKKNINENGKSVLG